MTLPERLAAYNTPEGAERYLDEYEKVHRRISDRRERRILRRWSRQLDSVDTALDLPCGWGRYLPLLTDVAEKVIEADYSTDMVLKSRALHPESPVLGGLRCLGHEIPLADGGVDLVFSMRLSHHLVDPVLRRDHLREILRVADQWVIFTYFDHASLKNVLRRARTRLRLCDKPPKSTMRRVEVHRIVAESSFELCADPFLFPVGSGHRVTLARSVP